MQPMHPKVNDVHFTEQTYARLLPADRSSIQDAVQIAKIFSNLGIQAEVHDYAQIAGNKNRHLYAVQIPYSGEIGPSLIYDIVAGQGLLDQGKAQEMVKTALNAQKACEQFRITADQVSVAQKDMLVSLIEDNIEGMMGLFNHRTVALPVLSLVGSHGGAYMQETLARFLGSLSQDKVQEFMDDFTYLRKIISGDEKMVKAFKSTGVTIPNTKKIREVYIDEVLRQIHDKFGELDFQQDKRSEYLSKVCFIFGTSRSNFDLDPRADEIRSRVNNMFPNLPPIKPLSGNANPQPSTLVQNPEELLGGE